MNDDIRRIVQDEIRSALQASQKDTDSRNLYGVPKTPFHIHNGIDSPLLAIQSISGFPSLSSSQAGLYLAVNTSGTGFAFTSNVLADHYTNQGNITTGETDLYSDSIPANALATNGNKILAEYGGSFVSSGTATREIKIYFAGTQIFDTGALTLSLSSAWVAYVTIIRVSSTFIRYSVSLTTEGAALAAYTAVGELTGLTLSGANILKITGQAAGAGAATNDIIAKVGYVEKVYHAA